ncbi:unnamed protein product [Fraxinus pennsylvanica]|uniref:Uncharacterized protein n=1 Tax=Fraxinus pennsylvanica TaxID=56036 RepID=A0AAD1ZX13_9LAMI|nr:unnamed protein product [Fraxinus pennsylvanica]
MYNIATNRFAEAFDKTLHKSKRDWHERIGEVLWAYLTPTQATTYALVYGVKVVLPSECQIPSLRIVIQEGLTTEENAHFRLEKLKKKRLDAKMHLKCYQARMVNSFNKKSKAWMKGEHTEQSSKGNEKNPRQDGDELRLV